MMILINQHRKLINLADIIGKSRRYLKLSSELFIESQSKNDEIRKKNKFTTRSHTCGDITLSDVNRSVSLAGWVQFTRFNCKIVSLEDSFGSIQCIFDQSLLKSGTKFNNGTVLGLAGTVRLRPKGQVNSKAKSGQVEIHVDTFEVLNETMASLPILPRDNNQFTDDLRLKYRYLDLRRKEMQASLRFRSDLCNKIRQRLLEYNFVECETPTLFNRTPGGSNEFIVPTRFPKKFYSLVQSPQQLKQLLMVGGLDRYFQVARCYRDESIRSDRQPEFTQIDIELSFTNQAEIKKLIDELTSDALSLMSSYPQTGTSQLNEYECEIPTLKYDDAMRYYGTDKPDLRFENRIETQEDNTIFIKFDASMNREHLENILSDIEKIIQLENSYNIKLDGNAIQISCTLNDKDSHKFLGQARLMIGRKLQESGANIYTKRISPVWIDSFPLFSQDSSGKLSSEHHPFTQPTKETLHLLDSEPLKVRAQSYDLVINGNEIASGSIRIHNANLQKKIFDLLDVNASRFEYFLEALQSGCPPHGGIAFGLDRLCSTLLYKESIREVIAFPKTASGRDNMTNCPEELSDSVKNLYYISSH